MPFQLPELPYKKEALAPLLSSETIDFHYGKHHLAYVNNLNNLVPGTEFENADLAAIIMKADGAIFNNAAQIWNHTFYFESFSPKPVHNPSGQLAEAINKSFGSFTSFQEQFTKASITLFGSGWSWLVRNSDGSLQVIQEPNAGNPMKKGLKPLMTCDVWEHAYYIDYRNRRPDYVKAFLELIDWDIISKRY
jgi:Fe-Mn family superoxide dismutase